MKSNSSSIWQFTRVVGTAVAFSALILFIVSQKARPKTGGLEPGLTLPAIQVEGWVNGPPPDAGSLSGKILVVDAWATWCGPCFREAPHLVKLHEKYKDRGVVFLGLTDENSAALPAIEKFLKQTGVTWPNGYGAGETLAQFRHEGIPAIWVVGRDGRIVWNFDSPGEIEEGIEKALNAK